MTNYKSTSLPRRSRLYRFLQDAAGCAPDFASLDEGDRSQFIEDLCGALSIQAGELIRLTDQQQSAVVPFVTAAVTGLNARQTIRALRALNVGFPPLDKSEVELGLHCALQHLRWKDFGNLAEAWGVGR
tara:strand:- start:30697 stop:31083 length:387 start_codon:yes stop_codon:yes gene_type:complete